MKQRGVGISWEQVVGVLMFLLTAWKAAAGTDCRWEAFRDLNSDAKAEVIRSCAPNEQVELYLLWSAATIPSNNDLARALAFQGTATVPAIVARMERSRTLEDDLATPKLLFVLVLMKDGDYYEVASDTDLMTRLERVVANMKDEGPKESASKLLGWIRQPRQ